MAHLNRLLDRLTLGLTDPADTVAGDGELQSRVRAKQIEAIVRLTPVVMPANAINALALVLVFHLSGEPMLAVSLWAAAACGAALWFFAGWALRRRRPFPDRLGPRTTGRTVRNAALLALLWAFPSVALMPSASVTSQAFLILLAGGMVSGGVTCFYPVPRAAAAYAGVLILAAVVGAAQSSSALLVGGLTVTASYLLVVGRVIARHSEIFVSEIVARIELEEKTRRIGALMERTEQKARQVARESAVRLEEAQKMEAVGRLTGGMAHDFNNILAVIRGNAELARDEGAADLGLIGEIVAATERGEDVIRKLLAFSRRQALEPGPVDARAAARSVASSIGRLLGEGVTVETRAPPDLWPAEADPTQLEAALLNLALNSRDALPAGGVIEFAFRNRRIGSQEAAALSERVGHEVPPGDYVAIAVSDNGVGMNAETAARAFEPFFTTRPVGSGTGLGLSMVLGFVRQSGGFVTLDTAEDEGTRVTLHLARASRAPGKPKPGPGAEIALGEDETVLLVEDRDDVRRTLKTMLESLGYEVFVAGDAADAEAAIDRCVTLRLVVSDIVLPGGMDGRDLAARLAEARPELPVLLISGFPGLEANPPPQGVRVLRKPFSRRALAEAVRAALDTPG